MQQMEAEGTGPVVEPWTGVTHDDVWQFFLLIGFLLCEFLMFLREFITVNKTICLQFWKLGPF